MLDKTVDKAPRREPRESVAAEPPLTPKAASRIWRRDAIKEFTFAQPPRSVSHTVKRRPGSAKRVRHTAPQMPHLRDVTVEPEGRPTRRPVLRAMGERATPLTVYPPDGRWNFTDTTYPWRACGRVVTARGQGAGAIVGPRHILTVSHVVDWTETNGSIGWLRFEPDFNNGDVFAPSMAQITYSYEHVTGSTEGEYDIAEDYVVCVMDRRLGDELGWLGTKTYDDGWDGGNYWAHVGYPGDVGGGQRPAFEGGFNIANSWSPGFFEEGAGLDMLTYASTNHGDSGGPVFGFWSDGPYVVGVVSAEGSLDPNITDWSTRTGNWLAGGHEMPDLVNQARNDHP